MIKLLRADFARVFKSRIFWLCEIFMFGFASYAVYDKWKYTHKFPELYSPPDDLLFAGALFIGLVIAVFMGSFVGADYKNGTIRNKLIVGHSRVSMYLSNLVVCVSASLIMHVTWFALLIGASKIGLIRDFETSTGTMLLLILISFFTIIAFAAIYLLLCMLITSKSTSSVTVLLLFFVMLIATISIQERLYAAEYEEPYSFTYVDENGEVYEEYFEGGENLNYISGTKRKVFEFLNDLIPSCQVMQLDERTSIGQVKISAEDHVVRLPLYALSITVVTTAMGIFIFRRKNLK